MYFKLYCDYSSTFFEWRGRNLLPSRIHPHMSSNHSIMLIPSQHQRQVILFDPVWPLSNACHWLFSYVYIMGLEESLWIFMLHYNRMLSMKWNTALLEDCLPWDTNLNLHIAHCIQIIVLYASTCRTHPSISWSSWNIKIPSKVDIFFLSVMLPI